MAFLTLAWIALLVWSMTSAGPLLTFEQVLAHAAPPPRSACEL